MCLLVASRSLVACLQKEKMLILTFDYDLTLTLTSTLTLKSPASSRLDSTRLELQPVSSIKISAMSFIHSTPIV